MTWPSLLIFQGCVLVTLTALIVAVAALTSRVRDLERQLSDRHYRETP